jgi:hypothetical protein
LDSKRIAAKLIPPEPPVAIPSWQNGAEGARARRFCAAERTLAAEHRSAISENADGRLGGVSGYPAGGL